MAASAEKINPDVLADLNAQSTRRGLMSVEFASKEGRTGPRQEDAELSQDVLADLIAQSQARKTSPPDILEDLQHQKRLREGDYDLTTLPGMFKGAAGVVENIAQMMSGFASAIPGAAAGLGAAAGARDWQAYPEAFAEQAEKTTFAPRTIKGKKIQSVIEGTYNEYINERWTEYLAEQVDNGFISPAEATYFRTSADALIMGALMKGGQAVRTVRRIPKPKETIIDLDEAPPLEGEYLARQERGGPGRSEWKLVSGQYVRVRGGPDSSIRLSSATGVVDRPLIGQRKALPAPEEIPLRIAIRMAAEKGHSRQAIEEAIGDAKSVEEAVSRIDEFAEKPSSVSAFDDSVRLGRQAGVLDPEVFREGVSILLRPGVRGARGVADLGHALARQVAFKHVTDIRKINSPTAKMLADRIMPLEDSKIPLDAGFHELVSVKTGEYNTRIENILEPLRKHVINKDAAKTARLIALPKKVNADIFRALDTGKVPSSLAPAVRALRGILNDILKYQVEAG